MESEKCHIAIVSSLKNITVEEKKRNDYTTLIVITAEIDENGKGEIPETIKQIINGNLWTVREYWAEGRTKDIEVLCHLSERTDKKCLERPKDEYGRLISDVPEPVRAKNRLTL